MFKTIIIRAKVGVATYGYDDVQVAAFIIAIIAARSEQHVYGTNASRSS